MTTQPFVTVLTPTYNMGRFLAECIDSVLGGTYQHFEYIIVNNCSTDESLAVASKYAQRDSRVRIHNNAKLVPVIENHNIAFGLMSPEAKYCKVVSADDFLFPDCISRLVELAEENPSVGIAGSYQLSGSQIRWQGFEYPHAVISGRELCRRMLLEGNPSFGFGTPTSLLYRADLVRRTPDFYPNASPHADTSACFRDLRSCDFGFVYQVLSYERTHAATQSTASANINRYVSAYLDDVQHYGGFYLEPDELARKTRETIAEYDSFLAVNLFSQRDQTFWNYHSGRLRELGHPMTKARLLKALATKVLREVVNPGQALRKFWHHAVSSRRMDRQSA
jgi:glycosyltransferase involved in cell wall biosynthesis